MTTFASALRSKPALRWAVCLLLLAALLVLLVTTPFLLRWLAGTMLAGLNPEVGQLVAAGPIGVFYALTYLGGIIIALADRPRWQAARTAQPGPFGPAIEGHDHGH